jgi:hypothetical protein
LNVEKTTAPRITAVILKSIARMASYLIRRDIPVSIKNRGHSSQIFSQYSSIDEKLFIKVSIPRVKKKNPQNKCLVFILTSPVSLVASF